MQSVDDRAQPAASTKVRLSCRDAGGIGRARGSRSCRDFVQHHKTLAIVWWLWHGRGGNLVLRALSV